MTREERNHKIAELRGWFYGVCQSLDGEQCCGPDGSEHWHRPLEDGCCECGGNHGLSTGRDPDFHSGDWPIRLFKEMATGSKYGHIDFHDWEHTPKLYWVGGKSIGVEAPELEDAIAEAWIKWRESVQPQPCDRIGGCMKEMFGQDSSCKCDPTPGYGQSEIDTTGRLK